MPGAMRKMGVYLGLVEEDDGYGDVDPARARPCPRRVRRPTPAVATAVRGRAPGGARLAGRVTTVRLPHERGGAATTPSTAERGEYAEVDRSSYRITTLHPRTYNEARTIGEHFRAGTPVIMNLSEMDDADAKRLVDFAAGLTFGLHGRIERVTAKVFLLSPHNVTVTAQDKAAHRRRGFL